MCYPNNETGENLIIIYFIRHFNLSIVVFARGKATIELLNLPTFFSESNLQIALHCICLTYVCKKQQLQIFTCKIFIIIQSTILKSSLRIRTEFFEEV